MAEERSAGDASRGAYRFRVSDALAVPLRGHMLRLRLLEGQPSIKELTPGKRIRLLAPDGRERIVSIVDHAATGGRQTQQRLDQTRELDVVISAEDAGAGDECVDIGWFATPAS